LSELVCVDIKICVYLYSSNNHLVIIFTFVFLHMKIPSMMQNSATSGSNSSSLRIMQSGSNYLEAGWQIQHPNSATVLLQLDGDIPEGGYIMVIAVPFLHH
jgi:hypothetical protein